MPSRESDLGSAPILVVDDDPRALLAVRAALGDDPYELVLAASGVEALRLLLEREFAMILLDVRMPTLDGFQTARLIRAREHNRHTPIVFVTARRHDDDEVLEGYALGAVDFLFKPVQPEILRTKVAVFVELHHRAERLAQLERRNNERRLTEERQRWEAEALRVENTRKDEFLAILSHELRNPLNALVLSIPLILSSVDATMAPHVEAMDRQVRHLARLVDDLLDVGRISSGKILLRSAPTTLAAAIDQAVEMAVPLMAEQQHTLRIDAPSEPIPLMADGDRLTQIVCNLLSNAARYTDRGGHVTLGYGLDGDTAWIRVTDDGRGIPGSVLPRVFDLFAQERPNGKGLGVGLALARTLVQLHGGTLTARSEGPGRGSTFEVRFPRVLPEPLEPAPEEATGGQERLRILVVDDNDDVRSVTASLLEICGHDVEQAATGEEAVVRAVRRLPDVVLLDLAMPGLDGFGTAECLREQLGDRTPLLIAVSGFGAAQDRERTRAAAFAAHLLKPVEPEQLLTTLAALTR